MAEQRDVQALAEKVRDALKLAPSSRAQNPLGPWRNDPKVDTALAALDELVLEHTRQEEQRVRATLTRLDDAKSVGTIFDHSREALEAAYTELERAEEHHCWHHEQERREVEADDERLRVLMVIAEALEELPQPLSETLSDDAETQVRELHAHAVVTTCPDCNVNASVGQGPCEKHAAAREALGRQK